MLHLFNYPTIQQYMWAYGSLPLHPFSYRGDVVCRRRSALAVRAYQAGGAIVAASATVVSVSVKVKAPVGTCSLVRRAAQHAVAVCAGLSDRARIAAGAAVFVVGSDIGAVVVAELAVCRTDAVFRGLHCCRGFCWRRCFDDGQDGCRDGYQWYFGLDNNNGSGCTGLVDCGRSSTVEPFHEKVTGSNRNEKNDDHGTDNKCFLFQAGSAR